MRKYWKNRERNPPYKQLSLIYQKQVYKKNNAFLVSKLKSKKNGISQIDVTGEVCILIEDLRFSLNFELIQRKYFKYFTIFKKYIIYKTN